MCCVQYPGNKMRTKHLLLVMLWWVHSTAMDSCGEGYKLLDQNSNRCVQCEFHSTPRMVHEIMAEQTVSPKSTPSIVIAGTYAQYGKYFYEDKCTNKIQPCDEDQIYSLYTPLHSSSNNPAAYPARGPANCLSRAVCDSPGQYRGPYPKYTCTLCGGNEQARPQRTSNTGYGVDRYATCECSKGASWDKDQGCVSCPVDMFKNITGNTECIKCARGVVSNEAIGKTSESECLYCRNGTLQVKIYTNTPDSPARLRCERCPHSLADLIDLWKKFYLQDHTTARHKIQIYMDYNEADGTGSRRFFHDFYWNPSVCGHGLMPFDAGTALSTGFGSVKTWSELVLPRTQCDEGESDENTMDKTVANNKCVECSPGKFKPTQDVFDNVECRDFQKCSMEIQSSANAGKIPYTLGRSQNDTYSHTTGRKKKPHCVFSEYTPFMYPQMPSPEVSYSYHDHIEANILHDDNVKSCGTPGPNAVDFLLRLWKSDDVRLPLLYNDTTCRMGCKKGHEFSHTVGGEPECNVCQKGKYKAHIDDTHACVREACKCQQCEPGKYAPQTGAQTCTLCPLGFYCNGGEHIKKCLSPGSASDGVCTPQNSYLTECAEGETSQNCVECPQFTKSKTLINVNSWTEFEHMHCRGTETCTWKDGKYWNYESGTCKSCVVVQNALPAQWLDTHACMPICASEYYLHFAPSSNPDTDRAYKCQPCHKNYADVCGSDPREQPHYVAPLCHSNLDTQCLSCVGVCGPLHMSRGNSIGNGITRCGCACVLNAGNGYAVHDVTVSAALWVSVSPTDIVKQLMSQNIHNSSVKTCLRWSPDAVDLCARMDTASVLDLDTDYTAKGLTPEQWPTIYCRPMTAKCGPRAIFGSQLFPHEGNYMSDNFVAPTDAEYECHCMSGFFGVYNSLDSLVECKPCNGFGSTSHRGTQKQEGCHCDAGFALMKNGPITQPCQPCAQHNTSHNNYYCPGGLPNMMLWQIVGHAFFSNATMPQSFSCEPDKYGTCECPKQTNVRNKQFATNAIDCRPEKGYKTDDSNVLTRCDTSEEGAPESKVNIWTDDINKPFQCHATCGRGALMKSPSAFCRCDLNTGYTFPTPHDNECVCAPGWHLPGPDEACEPCPASSYCEGADTPPTRCPVDMFSPSKSRNKEQCRCVPGNYMSINEDPAQKYRNYICRECPVDKYCAEGCQESFKSQTPLYIIGQCEIINARNSFFDTGGFLAPDSGMAMPEFCKVGEQKTKIQTTRTTQGKFKCESGAKRWTSDKQTTRRHTAVLLNILTHKDIAGKFYDQSADDVKQAFELYNPDWEEVLDGVRFDQDISTDKNVEQVHGPGGGIQLTDSRLRIVFEYAVVFVAALQVLCAPPEVLVLNTENTISRLDKAFVCKDVSGNGAHVVNRIHSLPGQKPLGYMSFVDRASHQNPTELESAETHLPWVVALDCTRNTDVRIRQNENITCDVCDVGNGAQLRVKHVALVQLSRDTDTAVTMTTFVVFMDTATQHFWSHSPNQAVYGRNLLIDVNTSGSLIFAQVVEPRVL